MANKYYDGNNGSDSNDGSTPALAKLTRNAAVSASNAGDKVIAVNGIQIAPGGYANYNDDRIESAQDYRKAIIQPNSASNGGSETAYVGRIPSGRLAANNPAIIENRVFDGINEVGAAFQLDDQSQTIVTEIRGCEFKNSNSYGFVCFDKAGVLDLINCKISGPKPSAAYLGFTGSLSSRANQTIKFQGLECEVDPITASTAILAISQVATPTNTLDLHVTGMSGLFNVSNNASIYLLNLVSKDKINVQGCKLTITGDETEQSAIGIRVAGKASGYETSDIDISNNTIYFSSGVGYAISYGDSTVDSHITGGSVSGNVVVGKYYPGVQTPHNFVMGQGTVGNLTGNISVDGYVGYLISKTDSCNVIGNLAYDCYGPNFYIKGTTLCEVKDNIAVVSSKYTQHERAIISVTEQGGVDTAGANIKQNYVVVEDVSKIHSLAQITDANQVCAFERNTYIIPDTVDLSTAQLFSYQSFSPTDTLAQWNARSEVTNDVIVQLPLSEVKNIIASYTPSGIDIPRAVTYISSQTTAATSSGFTIQPSQELEIFAAPRLGADEFVKIEVNDVSLGWRTMGIVINSDDTSGFIVNNKRVAQEYRVTKSATQVATRIESN
tara:strand:+ start:71 stop:1900 length:1830 start_codon:yes stop_codon:yes gene_type:complete